jgi:hypothetical protein
MKNEELPIEDRVDRTGLLDLQNNPHKKWALFVRGSRAASSKFKSVFETEQEAHQKAQEYSVKRISDGSLDFTFYVVEIKKIIGIENGKFVDKTI